jgi:glucoamylase
MKISLKVGSKFFSRFLALSVLFGMGVLNLAEASKEDSSDFAAWIKQQRSISEIQLFKAVSPSDGARGAVMASPSRSHPNYYYHWIRDAALVMDTFYLFQNDRPEKIEGMLIDYLNFSRRNQLTDNWSGTAADRGLGEPKFEMNGNAYNEGWGRPQNDGPALRALTLMKLANQWLNSGKGHKVTELLYRAEIPAMTLLKADLEFVSHHWNESNFDLWEETSGMHFYTLLVQMTALNEGAKLALVLGDGGAAEFYTSQSHLIEEVLKNFWSTSSNYYLATMYRTAGLATKNTQLDVAVILGVLHSKRENGLFSIRDPKVLKTAQALENTFKNIYAINSLFPGENLGVAIGRYPEDTYDGYNTGKTGNPWYLTTLALGEFYYKLSLATPTTKNELKKAYFKKAESFLSRVRKHTPNDGNLYEQFNRSNGFAQGATHLTWSYAAFLTAEKARVDALANLP